MRQINNSINDDDFTKFAKTEWDKLNPNLKENYIKEAKIPLRLYHFRLLEYEEYGYYDSQKE